MKRKYGILWSNFVKMYMKYFYILICYSFVSIPDTGMATLETYTFLQDGDISSRTTPIDLGRQRHHCVGNIEKCDNGGFAVSLWVIPGNGDATIKYLYYLSNGGQSPHSEGYYLRRNYGKDFEVGVALNNVLWNVTFFLQESVEYNIAFTWNNITGLQVYVDGILANEDSNGMKRVFTSPQVDPFQKLSVGEANSNVMSGEVVNVIIYNITHVSWFIGNESDVLQLSGQTDETYFKGCSAEKPVNSEDSVKQSDIQTFFQCRKHCYAMGKTYTSYKQGFECSCMTETNFQSLVTQNLISNPCSGNEWYVYRTGGDQRNTDFPMTLNVDVQEPTSRGYIRPNETVTFTLTTDAVELVTYYINYDDGVNKVTTDEKISYCWISEGSYNISITAKTRLTSEVKYVMITIEWRDEGVPPELVSLKPENNISISKDISSYLTAISIDNKNCTLNFGDGEILKYENEMEMIFNKVQPHRYKEIGFYPLSFECVNQFGVTRNATDIVAIHPIIEYEYYPMHVNISIPVNGIEQNNYFKMLTVLVDEKEIPSYRVGKYVLIPPETFTLSGDHVIQLIGNGRKMFTKVFNIQEVINDIAINANMLYTEIYEPISFNFIIGKGDFLHIYIQYGDGHEEYLYAPAMGQEVTIVKNHSYSVLGVYNVDITVGNDISSKIVQQVISIERPVENVTMEAINTTVIGDPTVFIFEVDMEKVPAMPVQVKFQYGDGNSESVILGRQQNTAYLLTHNYTYNTYGIYRVKATVGNNISSTDVSTIVQVGENITYVDVYTDKDRELQDENITFIVHIPRGVPIKLDIDTGDGNVITMHYPELTNQYVDGIIPPSTTTIQPPDTDDSSSSGDSEVESDEKVLTRQRRSIDSDPLDGSGDLVDTEEKMPLIPITPTKPPNEDLHVSYKYPKAGKYSIKVRVSNKFNYAETELCKEIIVVTNDIEPTCQSFDVSVVNSTTELSPLVKVRSEEIQLGSDVNMDCSASNGASVVTRYTWSTEWETKHNTWRPELEVCETEQVNSTLIIDPNTLWYGMYRLLVKVSLRTKLKNTRKKRMVGDVNAVPYDNTNPTLVETLSGYTYLKVVPTPLVAIIQDNNEKRDETLWDVISVNMTPSYDPDVIHSNKSGMTFHLFCYSKPDEEIMKGKTLDEMLAESVKIANNTFNTASIYETETSGCFVSYERIWVLGFEVVFPGDHASTNDSIVFDMFVQKDSRISRTQAEIRVWATNISMDNALDAIDALLASGDTSAALMVIDMATDALNVGGDSNDTNAKDARAAMRGKLIGVLGNVADAVGNFDQLDKTAGAINKITEVSDEVSSNGRKKAAGALGKAADKTDSLSGDANLGAVTGMAQNMIGAAGNVLPFAEDPPPEIKETEIAVTTAQPEYLLRPTGLPAVEEPVEIVPTCCEREAGLCEWIEPKCVVVDVEDRKNEVWDDVMCDSIHPDDMIVIRTRFELSKLAKKLDIYDEKKATTTGGWNACLKIGDVIGKKQDGNDGETTNIDTPKMKMKVASVNSDSGSSLGAFNVPSDVMGDLSGGAAATVMDTPNPFTYSDSADDIKGKVMTMAFNNPDGTPMKIANTTEPFNIWMPGKPELLPSPKNFTFLSSPTGASMNYHTVNITTNDTGLHLIIRPESEHDVYYVYVKYGAFPNETYFDWKGQVPNMAAFKTNDTWKLEQLYYTAFPPGNFTKYNGTYRIGIRLKETKLNLEQLGKSNNFTYTMQVFLSGCRFWDMKKDTWSSEGCKVGNLTTAKETQCLCNHLTSFGGDFVVPPNTIDFNTVFNPEKFLESIPVFVTVILVIAIYIATLVWARKEDKKDLIKWGASPLEDNLPTDNYHYQMTVSTGVKKHASTTSNVSFILSGDECDSGVRRLRDGHRNELPSGSIYNYILSVEQTLGPLNYLRIWHDNSGKGKKKSWYLNQIMITDIQTGDKYFFLCGRWMAVEEDDGQVERILPVAGLSDLAAFRQLFSSSVRKKLSNDHMWFSILSRPTKSTFTRVQRVSCCMSLLFLTMITNCMFFKADSNAENVTALKVGPFSFTMHQLFISIVSTAIVFPPSLAIVTIFRKAKPKNNSIMQVNQSRSKKFKWRSINRGSALWTNVEKSRKQKIKEAVMNITRLHQKNKYEAEEYDTLRKGKKKKKKGFMLPHWTNYIAWTLVFFSVVASGFFTILYSMEWGREKSIEWLTTFLMSFFQSVIVVQPIKVLLLAAFISFIIRKPETDDEEEEAFDEAHMGETSVKPAINLTASQQDLQEMLKRRQMKASDLPPPDTESLERAREYRLKEMAMESIIRECTVYFVFVIVLFFLSYQTRDADSFVFANNIKNQFWSPKFTAISRPDTFWLWLNSYFLPVLYTGPHDNGQPLTWQESLQIDDRVTIRVGVPRLRQQRIKPDSCKVQPIMRSFVHHCRGEYNWNDDDTKDYLPHWKLPNKDNVNMTVKAYGDRYCSLVGGDLANLNSEKSSPWIYRNSLELKNAPYAGQLGVYKGGGYSAAFRRTRKKTEKVLSILEKDEWVDVHTRAVFTEFTLYNANVNLFASVIMLVEWMATGSAITRAEVKVFRLYSYVGGFGSIVIFMEAVYVCFTLYFLITLIRMVRKHKMKYFKDFWNMLELSTLILSIVSIAMYGMKKVFGYVAIEALKDSGSGEYVNFVTLSMWDESFVLVLALVVFTSTIKFIKMLKFNKRMGMLGDTLKLAAKDLKPFMLMFFVYFLSFCMTAYVLFGKNLPSYGSFVGTIESLFAFSLGDFNFHAFERVDKLLGPAFFFMYVIIVYIGLMGMFLTIIDLSFAQVKANADFQSNDHEIVDFAIKKFKGVLGMG